MTEKDGFLRRMTSRKFWIWVVTTAFTGVSLFTPVLRNFDLSVQTLCLIFVLSIWALVNLLYYGDDIIVNGIAQMLGKAELKVGLGK